MDNEQKIRQIARDEAIRVGNNNRFNVNPVSQIKNNALNPNNTPQQTIIYAGRVPQFPAADFNDGFLPVGWTAELDSGTYRINHNLGTDLYSVTCSAIANPSGLPAYVIFPDKTGFYVAWGLASTGIYSLTTSFSFTLVQINNKKAQNPQYTVIGQLS